MPPFKQATRPTCDGNEEQLEKERVERGIHEHRQKEVDFGELEHAGNKEHEQENQKRVGDPVENEKLAIVELAEQRVQQNDPQKEEHRVEDLLRGELLARKHHDVQQEKVERRPERRGNLESRICRQKPDQFFFVNQLQRGFDLRPEAVFLPVARLARRVHVDHIVMDLDGVLARVFVRVGVEPSAFLELLDFLERVYSRQVEPVAARLFGGADVAVGRDAAPQIHDQAQVNQREAREKVRPQEIVAQSHQRV